MSKIEDMMCDLKKRAEESIEHYAKKTDWKPEDLEVAYNAVKMYDKICDVQMKDGIWNEMKDDWGNGNSGAMRMPRMSYGVDSNSYARGRDPMTGQYTSNGSWRDGSSMGYSTRNAMPNSYGGQNSSNGPYAGNSYGSQYDNNQSGHSVKDRMIWALEQQMDSAKTEYERNEIREAIKQIERRQMP